VKVFLGADHNGFELKNRLKDYLQAQSYEVVDEGDTQLDSDDDFPQYAGRVVAAMLASDEKEPKGILICGSGQGMCIAANRFKGIRASLAWDEAEAKAARNDDDSNILCLAARELTDFDNLLNIVNVWLKTPFTGAERFVRRIKQLDELN
jgi:ribose 5-phosphate isomerase B